VNGTGPAALLLDLEPIEIDAEQVADTEVTWTKWVTN